MPYRVTMSRARSVACSRSCSPPVEPSPRTSSSAAMPPRVATSCACSALLVSSVASVSAKLAAAIVRPRDEDRHAVDVLVPAEGRSDDDVPDLVVGRAVALLGRQDATSPLRALEHADDRLLELLLRDDAGPAADGEQRRLVDDAREVGAGEARAARRDALEVDVGRQRLATGVDAQDALAALGVGALDGDVAVEAARAHERRVEDVGAVRRGDDDDAGGDVEAVHLDEQLVEGLLALVGAAAPAARAALAAGGVELVDEHDGRRDGVDALEQVADAGRADADERLDELRAGDREERHAGLAGDRAGEQRLAGPGGAEQQHALGRGGAELLVLAGIDQVVAHLGQLGHGLVGAADVGEGHVRPAGTTAVVDPAEAHHLADRGAAAALADEQQAEQVGQDQHRHEELGDDAQATLEGLRVDLDLGAGGLQALEPRQDRRALGQRGAHASRAVRHALDTARGGVRRGRRLALDGRDGRGLGGGDLLRGAQLGDQLVVLVEVHGGLDAAGCGDVGQLVERDLTAVRVAVQVGQRGPEQHQQDEQRRRERGDQPVAAGAGRGPLARAGSEAGAGAVEQTGQPGAGLLGGAGHGSSSPAHRHASTSRSGGTGGWRREFAADPGRSCRRG